MGDVISFVCSGGKSTLIYNLGRGILKDNKVFGDLNLIESYRDYFDFVLIESDGSESRLRLGMKKSCNFFREHKNHRSCSNTYYRTRNYRENSTWT